MTAPSSRYDLRALAGMARSEMSKGQRIAATKAGITPPVGRGRERALMARYGLTQADFDALLAEQGGLCAVCRRRPGQYVDHNHATGQRRSILCPACNTLVGLIESDPHRLASALAYVAADARNAA